MDNYSKYTRINILLLHYCIAQWEIIAQKLLHMVSPESNSIKKYEKVYENKVNISYCTLSKMISGSVRQDYFCFAQFYTCVHLLCN